MIGFIIQRSGLRRPWEVSKFNGHHVSSSDFPSFEEACEAVKSNPPDSEIVETASSTSTQQLKAKIANYISHLSKHNGATGIVQTSSVLAELTQLSAI